MFIQAKAPQASPRGLNSFNSDCYSSGGLMTAITPDMSRRLIYSIVDGNTADDFTTDYNADVISVLNQLDYEVTPSYQLVSWW